MLANMALHTTLELANMPRLVRQGAICAGLSKRGLPTRLWLGMTTPSSSKSCRPRARGNALQVARANQSGREQYKTASITRELDGISRVIVVDGYNVCGSWPELKAPFHGGHIERARRLLLDELSFFTDAQVLVVFDAAHAAKQEPAVEKLSRNLHVVFAFDADEFIDREVANLTGEEQAEVWAVTSDNLTRTLASTAGARVISSADFGRHLKGLKAEDAKDCKTLDFRDVHVGTLGFALSMDTKSELTRMRNCAGTYIPPKEEHGVEKPGAMKGEGGSRDGVGARKGTKRQRQQRRRKKRTTGERERAPEGSKVKDIPSEIAPMSSLGRLADGRLNALRSRLGEDPKK